jgi:hypothetical protein
MAQSFRNHGSFLSRVILILVISISTCFAGAQNPQEKMQKLPAQSKIDLGEDPGPVYIGIVQQWAQLSNFAYNASQVIIGKLQLDVEKDPKLKAIWSQGLKQDLEQYFYELFYSPETIRDLAKIYAQYFTLEDMIELIKFYKSPIGQKLIKVDPELKVKTQQLGNVLLKKHEKEYIVIIGKYIKPGRSLKRETD